MKEKIIEKNLNKKKLNFEMKIYLLYHRLIQKLMWELRVKKKFSQSHIF